MKTRLPALFQMMRVTADLQIGKEEDKAEQQVHHDLGSQSRHHHSQKVLFCVSEVVKSGLVQHQGHKRVFTTRWGEHPPGRSNVCTICTPEPPWHVVVPICLYSPRVWNAYHETHHEMLQWVHSDGKKMSALLCFHRFGCSRVTLVTAPFRLPPGGWWEHWMGWSWGVSQRSQGTGQAGLPGCSALGHSPSFSAQADQKPTIICTSCWNWWWWEQAAWWQFQKQEPQTGVVTKES